MKDYNEMASSVFHRRDEYVMAQKKKKTMLLKIGVPSAALLLIVLVGLGFVLRGDLPEVPVIPPTEPSTSCPDTVGDATATDESVTDANISDPTATAEPEPSQKPGPADPTEPTNTIGPTKPTEPEWNIPSATSAIDSVLPSDPMEATSATSGDDNFSDSPNSGDSSISEGSRPQGQYPSTIPSVPVEEEPTLPAVPDDTEFVEDTTAMESTFNPDWTEETTGVIDVESVPTALTLYIGDNKYVAQVGDVVTIVAELYAQDVVDDIELSISAQQGKLRIVDLNDYGFSSVQAKSEWVPNIDFNFVSFDKWGNAMRLQARNEASGFDFTEKKVLLTFDAVVTEGGEAYVNPVIASVARFGKGDYYYENYVQKIADGIDLELYGYVTPKADYAKPVPSVEYLDPSLLDPFDYPEESSDGDLVINCGGRTYSADIGDTITYTVEVQALRTFENVQAILHYDPDRMTIIDRTTAADRGDAAYEAGEISAPNIKDALVNYYYNIDHNGGKPYRVCVLGSSVSPKYDFRTRKVLLQVEFTVTHGGVVNMSLDIQEMSINGDDVYFMYSQQKANDIGIYQYITVN